MAAESQSSAPSDGLTPERLLDFAEVQVGDRVTFSTRDNGFGGTGGLIDRTGTVTTKTEKTVVVSGVDILRYAEYGHRNTNTARLRRADWRDRQVRAAASPAAAARPDMPLPS